MAIRSESEPEHVHIDRAWGCGAYVYSLVAAVAPGIFPASFRDPNGAVSVYVEAAAVIVALVLLGQVLELKARTRTGAAIKALLGLAPKTARWIADDGSETDVPLDRIEKATGCECGLARRFLWMGSFWKEPAVSTNQ